MDEEDPELSREELLQRYGRQGPRAPGSERRSPFKFLDSYDLADADIFFGRDTEIEELLGHFRSYGHVLIYGESGSGKSSLVHCGLRSQIPEADALFIPLRVHTAGLPAVCHQICESASQQLGDTVEESPEAGLVETLRAAQQAASRPIVLFLDQFEELFIFHESAVRRNFAEELASIRTARLNVKVLIGVRQDFLGHLSELEDTVEGLFDNRFWLRRMSRENAAEAVVKACATCEVTIDGELAQAILHRLDPGGQGVELPYLQVVMDRLYRRAVAANPADPVITAGDVQQLGDITDILGTFLVEEVGKLPSPDAGRQILKAFVTREGTRRTLDRAAVGQEASGFGEAIPEDVLDAHLNQLASVRILREIADTDSYELRHDALAATVAGWISEVEKELIEVRDNLINRFKEYEARQGDAAALLDQSFINYLDVYRKRLQPLLSEAQSEFLQKSERRLRRIKRIRQFGAAGGIAATLIAVVAGWMYLQYRDAREAREKEKIAAEKLIFAKQAVNDMLTVVGDKTLEDVPQMEGVRAELLDRALSLYGKIGGGDEASRYDTAMAAFKVGEIRRIIGTGNDAKTAEKEYRSSIDQLSALSTEFPDKPLYRQQLGRAHMWLGELYRETDLENRADESVQPYNKAIRIQTELITSSQNNGEYLIDLARSHMNRGIHRKDRARKKKDGDASGAAKDFAEARSDYDRAQSLLTTALSALNDEHYEECRELLSKTHSNRGVLLKLQLARESVDKDLFEETKKSYLRAIDEMEYAIENRRQRKLPERLAYKLNLAMYHSNLANLLWDFDPDAKLEAAKHNTHALTLGQSLNVGTRQVRLEVANFYFNKAWFQKDDDTKQAIEEFSRALAVLETILDQNEYDKNVKDFKDECLEEIEKLQNLQIDHGDGR